MQHISPLPINPPNRRARGTWQRCSKVGLDGITRTFIVLLAIVMGSFANGGPLGGTSARADLVGGFVITVSGCTQDVSQFASLDDARPFCSAELSGAPVGLSFPEGGTQTVVTKNDGVAIFAPTIVGPYSVIPPADTAGLSGSLSGCVNINRLGGSRTSTGPVLNGEPLINFSGDQDVFCEIFMFPEAGFVPPPPESNGQIVVTTRTCTEDVGITTDFNVINPVCSSPMAGQAVTLMQDVVQIGTQTSDGDGQVIFSVAKGTYLVSQPIPAPFDSAWVTCAEFTPDGTQVTDFDLHGIKGQGNSPVTLGSDGNTVSCFFFLFFDGPDTPAGISGNILLCDANFDGMGANDISPVIISENCPQVGSSIAMSLIGTGGINTQITSGGDGTFAFPGPLPPGNFSLSADGPAGNSKPVALCTEARVGEFPATVLAHPDEGNNSVSIPVTIENSAILCTLLLYDPNGSAPGTTPDTTGTAAISIEARLCPEDFDSTDFGELDATCPVSDTPINFSISGPTSLTQTTGATVPNGVSFANLTPGNWTITETTPDGFGQAIVICAANNVNTGDFGDNTSLDVENGNSVTTDIAAGIDLRCTWFNTTAEVSGTDSDGSDGDSTGSNANGATLILVLRTCPEGYNPDTAKADPMKECTEFKDGVNISATDSKNKKQRHQTGEDEPGTATYTGLKSGVYRLHQGYPQDVQHGFILDCDSDSRTLTPLFIPLARIDATGSIKITLKAPETMTCNWFNIPNSADDLDQSSNATETNPQVTGNTESAGNATVSVMVRTCSGVPNPLACDPVASGFSVFLTNVDGQSDPVVLVANSKGVASGTIPAGTYAIDADTGSCLVSSAASTDDGSIQIPVEGEVKIDYYICT